MPARRSRLAATWLDSGAEEELTKAVEKVGLKVVGLELLTLPMPKEEPLGS